MKLQRNNIATAVFIGLLIWSNYAAAQEYDPMYFSSKDRKKERQRANEIVTPKIEKPTSEAYQPSVLTDTAGKSPSYYNDYVNTPEENEASPQAPQQQDIDPQHYAFDEGEQQPTVINNYYGNVYRDDPYIRPNTHLGVGFNPYNWGFGFGWGYGYSAYYWDPYFDAFCGYPYSGYAYYGWPGAYRPYFGGYRYGYYDGYYGRSRYYSQGHHHHSNQYDRRQTAPMYRRGNGTNTRSTSLSNRSSNVRRTPVPRATGGDNRRSSVNSRTNSNSRSVDQYTDRNSRTTQIPTDNRSRTSTNINVPRSSSQYDSRSSRTPQRSSSSNQPARTSSNYNSAPSRSSNSDGSSSYSAPSRNSNSRTYSSPSRSSSSNSSRSSSSGRSSRSSSPSGSRRR